MSTRLRACGAAGVLAGAFAMGSAAGAFAAAERVVPAGGAAGHAWAQSSVGYPFHVGGLDSIPIIVDFRTSFPRVSKVCLTAHFGKDDPLTHPEEIFVDYPEQAGEIEDSGHFLFWSNYAQKRPSKTVHTMRRCVTPTDPVRTPLDPARWLDGREVLYVEGAYLNNSDYGTATIISISAQIYE